MTAAYPLIFAPILKDKVWGGRRLSAFGKALPPNKNIGESWELADLSSTSASGGGGQAAHSVVINGPLAGKTIRDALNLWGVELLGSIAPAGDGGFPLLVKYLDAREHLSVQVHPSPGYLHAHPGSGAHLKTECWYILAAEPGSVIYKGLRPGVTRESFAAHIADKSVVADLVAVPAVVGDLHNLPSGTIHALGAGVLAAEIQTPSDTTFRVYDWEKELGRAPREMHVQQALECVDFSPDAERLDAARLPAGLDQARLVTTEFFQVDEARPRKRGQIVAVGTPERPAVVMMLAGRCELVSARGDFEPMTLAAGMTALIPASLTASVFLRALRESTLLRASVGKPGA